MWGQLTAARAQGLGVGWGWACQWTKAAGGMLAPPPPQSSHFICHVVVLSGRHVAVGTDCGAVVLVARWHEGQAVRVDLMAGSAVSLSRLLLVLTQLPFPQSLQHLGTVLQHTQKHTFKMFLHRRSFSLEPGTFSGPFWLQGKRGLNLVPL